MIDKNAYRLSARTWMKQWHRAINAPYHCSLRNNGWGWQVLRERFPKKEPKKRTWA